MILNYAELDAETRSFMLKRFEAEEATEAPYRSKVLTEPGLQTFPELIRAAIAQGDDETLRNSLMDGRYWKPRSGASRLNVEEQAYRLAVGEFNVWYVQGTGHRLLAEGIDDCEVYRAGQPKWTTRTSCCLLEGQSVSVRHVLAGHRVPYHTPAPYPNAIAVPGGPNCHHTIRRPRR